MAIPDYQTLMLPLLRFAADGQEYRNRDAVIALADELRLTDEERAELQPSGRQPVFTNRIGWAKTYMKKAGLFESPKRGLFKITPVGLDLLQKNLPRIDDSILWSYPGFQEFKSSKKDSSDTQVAEPESSETPEDALASAYRKIRSNTEDELLETVKQASASYFEQIVIDVLVAMGYGGNRQDAAKSVGKSGDEGIDGIINEDKLGLDVIYIQAKRWENTVGRPEIQKFAGALQGQRARKGVFITTANFSRDAIEYADSIDNRIILIDGARLAKLMFENNVGVSPAGVYVVKKMDSDYFDEG